MYAVILIVHTLKPGTPTCSRHAPRTPSSLKSLLFRQSMCVCVHPRDHK